MRHALILAILGLLAAVPVAAQQTTVSGTVTDPNGLVYSNATIQAELIPAGVTPTINGQAVAAFRSANLDAAGHFSMTLADNDVLSPSGTKWQFTVAESTSYVPLPFGTGPQKFVYAATITGASMNLSSAMSAVAPALTVAFGGSGGDCSLTDITDGAVLYDSGGACGGSQFLNSNTNVGGYCSGADSQPCIYTTSGSPVSSTALGLSGLTLDEDGGALARYGSDMVLYDVGLGSDQSVEITNEGALYLGGEFLGDSGSVNILNPTGLGFLESTDDDLELNSTAAYVDGSGNLTVAGCTGCGIGGTVSSPNVPYASDADTLSDSTFTYNNTGMDCEDGASDSCLQVTDPVSNITFQYGSSAIVATDTDDNGLVFGIFNAFGGGPDISESAADGSTCVLGTSYGAGSIACDGPGGSGLLFDPDTTTLSLGTNGFGVPSGNLALYDTDFGGPLLGASGDTLTVVGSDMGYATVQIPSIASTSGQRYVCVDTEGNLVSSIAACSGT